MIARQNIRSLRRRLRTRFSRKPLDSDVAIDKQYRVEVRTDYLKPTDSRAESTLKATMAWRRRYVLAYKGYIDKFSIRYYR